MKKILSVILVCVILLSVCACSGSENKFVGSWIVTENEGWNYFPDQLVLYKDHTGMMDGMECNWSVQNDSLTITTFFFGSLTYKYSFSGSKLSLSMSYRDWFNMNKGIGGYSLDDLYTPEEIAALEDPVVRYAKQSN